jgi:predicted transposase YbfD/YdcC
MVVLGQRKVAEKSNEIIAIPELLKILAISGCTVTIDAIGTQTNIAKAIIEGEADYVLSVKENQGHLYEGISGLFAVDESQNLKYVSLAYAQTTNKDHGRIEVRECWVPPIQNILASPEIPKVLRWWSGHGSSTARKPSGCVSTSPV